MDMLNITAFEGRTKTDQGCITTHHSSQVHVALGNRGAAPAEGDTLPPLWHWCAFPPLATNDELSQDGHPQRGDFLPPLGLPRRMWVGGSLEFHAPLMVGETITRRTTITRVAQKGTPERPMALVTLCHEIRGSGGVAVREHQDLAYLDIPKTFTPPKTRAMPTTPDAIARVDVTAPVLFRFSAVTFNAHRIHYDADYAREVERYPGTVIHGPYQAMQLMQLATTRRGRSPSLFSFRGVHPMFLGDALDLAAEEDGEGGLRLYAGQSGHQGTVAHALWDATL